jgi:IclR family transcriptional regulator, KDG regulon repressor
MASSRRPVSAVRKPARKSREPRRESMSSSLKCFQVMELLAEEPYELALTEIAAQLELPLASAHRIVATLCEAGFVEQEALARRYRLAGKALWVGTGYLRRSSVYRAAFLVLQETARRCCGLVHLATIDEDRVLYLHTVGSPSALYLYADTGERRLLHCTGLGKAMLAFQPPEVVARVLSQKLKRFTTRTITSAAELREELAGIRARGYAVDDEENAPGLRCLAAPILGRPGYAVAAFSMSAPASTLTDDLLDKYSNVIREAALRVSSQLGYRPATSNMQSLLRQD